MASFDLLVLLMSKKCIWVSCYCVLSTKSDTGGHTKVVFEFPQAAHCSEAR